MNMTKPQPNKRAAEPIKVASKAPVPKPINRKAINIAASSEEQKYEAIARTLTRPEIGAARIGSRFVRFGFKGCPDVLGQLKDGRLLGVEVKAQARRLRPEQAVFLERIRGAGGVAFVASNLRDVLRELGAL